MAYFLDYEDHRATYRSLARDQDPDDPNYVRGTGFPIREIICSCTKSLLPKYITNKVEMADIPQDILRIENHYSYLY